MPFAALIIRATMNGHLLMSIVLCVCVCQSACVCVCRRVLASLDC